MLGRLVVLVFLLLSAASYAYMVEIVNFTTVLDAAVKPDFVTEIDGCRVYIYILRDFKNASTPLFKIDKLPAIKRPAVLPRSNEEFFDIVLKAIGPDVVATVAVMGPSGKENLEISISARNSTELKEKIRKALDMPVFLDREVAEKFSSSRREKAAAVVGLRIKFGDTTVYVNPIPSNVPEHLRDMLPEIYTPMEIRSTNATRVQQILSRLEEAAGGKTLPGRVFLFPYTMSEEELERLRNAAIALEQELGTVRRYPDGVEGIIHIIGCGEGPCILVFPYPNGTTPDVKTAEEVVKRFVELAGVCKTPMVAEFWPSTGLRKFPARQQLLPLESLYVIIPAALLAVSALIIAAKRKRK